MVPPDTSFLLGDLFKSSRAKGHKNIPLLSVTLHDGLVERSTLDRRTETNLSPEEHLLVQPGFIAYNMMRVWQGALGRASCEGLVSPAYVVLKPAAEIDPLYAEYLFKTPRLIYLFWAYSYGLTKDRLRLYYNDFARIPVKIPSRPEQQKIARILSIWDKSITITEKLLANSQQQKKSLMQRLMLGKQRFSGFERQWQKVHFADIATLCKKKFDPKKEGNSVLECIELEHISQGSSVLIGSTTTELAVSTKATFQKDSVLFGKLRPYLRKYWLADRAGVCSTEIWVLNASLEKALPGYIHQLVQTDSFIDSAGISSGTHMPRADWNVVKDLVISLPELEEQHNIVSILSAADKGIQTLQQKLTHLKQEKKSLMQQLLTGKRRIKSDLIEEPAC